MAGNGTVQRVLRGVQERIDAGEIYRFWYDYMDPNDVGHMAPPWMSYGGSNCFPGDTLVVAPGVKRSYKRVYNGELVTLKTAGGHQLTGTPNHPILTSRGWVALDGLRKGDYVLSSPGFRRLAAIEPDIYHEPSCLQEVHRALEKVGLLERVPAVMMNFHGERPKSEVDVVNRLGELGDGLKSCFPEHACQFPFAQTDLAEGALFAESPPPQSDFGLPDGPQGFVRSASEGLPFFGAQARHVEPLSLGGVSQAYAGSLQVSPDSRSRYPEASGDGDGRFAPLVSHHDGGIVERQRTGVPALPGSELGGFGLGAPLDAGILEPFDDNRLGNPESLGESLLGLPSDVRLDKVINVKRYSFSGHVFTLQTERGWYIAEGIVTKNCTSLFNGIFGEMRDEGYPVAPIGGTGYWNSAVGMGSWGFYEKPNINKNYPPGCFGVSPYTDDTNQGHVQMVATGAAILGPASWGDQTIAQSDHSKGVNSDASYGWPGPNMDYTMAWTWNNIDWPTWVGLVDGVPILDGFPGYTASAEEIARWCGDQMEFFGLPRQLFVQASIPEVTSIWVENRQYGDISDIPGMTYNVDYDSFGPVQQRFQYYPFPWNFETAVWSFAQMALSTAPNPMPTDADGCAAWIADIQRPAEQYRGRYRRLDDGTDTYAWAMQLVGDSGVSPGRDYWMGFTSDKEQWMRGVSIPNNAWIKPTQSEGKVWLEFVPPGTTPVGTEYQTYGWMGFIPDSQQRMRGVNVPNNAWIRPTEQSGKVWLEFVPPAS